MPRAFWRAQLSARSCTAVLMSDASSIFPDQKLSRAVFSSRCGPIRGVPRVATEMEAGDEFDIGKPRDVGAGPDMREQQRRPCRPLASDTPGHPARGRYVIAAGFLACGSQPASAFPGLSPQWHKWTETRRLQLRGQLRHCAIGSTARTVFPLGSGSPIRRTTMRHVMGDQSMAGQKGSFPPHRCGVCRRGEWADRLKESCSPIRSATPFATSSSKLRPGRAEKNCRDLTRSLCVWRIDPAIPNVGHLTSHPEAHQM